MRGPRVEDDLLRAGKPPPPIASAIHSRRPCRRQSQRGHTELPFPREVGFLTRRSLLGLLALPAATLKGQQPPARPGMASRGVKPLPRGKPSGLPFHARLTDIAGQAGLKQVVVCGHPNHADYFIEPSSCGVPFLDYDN